MLLQLIIIILLIVSSHAFIEDWQLRKVGMHEWKSDIK